MVVNMWVCTLLTRCVKYNSTRNSRRPIGVLDHSPKK
ncbi:unnamed protein product, partial [Mesorhabditis belari]|uniref:Uncharacterized protein n=1 Tax=Mesorhabditis belari TaxID=2138241 RepID=A0AAF3FBS3_9BILA